MTTTTASRRVQFGGITKAAPASTKTEYPVLPEERFPSVYQCATRILERGEKVKAIESLVETDKLDVRAMTLGYYFELHQGRVEIPSSISIPTEVGEATATFMNKYPEVATREPQLRAVIGDKFDELFRQQFTIKVDGDKLPADKTQQLVDELATLFRKHGCIDALSWDDKVKPMPDFHVRRHTLFAPDVNLEIACILPGQINVQPARGRK